MKYDECVKAAKLERQTYRKRMELGLMIALGLVLSFVVILPKKLQHPVPKTVLIQAGLENIDLPPVVQHSRSTAPPALPQVPIPVEDEWLPSEATIDETLLDLSMIELPDAPEALPAYVERKVVFPDKKEKQREYKRGEIELALLIDTHGRVDSLYVIYNPHKSEEPLADAIRRAYRTRFVEEASKKKKLHWIKRKF